MTEAVVNVLKDQGRGIVGALLVGTPLLFTMETWRRAEAMSTWTLLAFALGGLIVIMGVLRVVGFRKASSEGTLGWRAASELGDLVLQSSVAALAVLFTFGILQWGDPLIVVVRLVLIQMVPLGLGAAAANEILRESKGDQAERAAFPKDVGIFSIGAIFFALQIAPTEETSLMAAMANWWRLSAAIVLSLLVIYLALYELELRGHSRRTAGRSRLGRAGQAFLVYVTATSVAALLLVGYGGMAGESLPVIVQRTVVLSFPAAVGGAIAEVGMG